MTELRLVDVPRYERFIKEFYVYKRITTDLNIVDHRSSTMNAQLIICTEVKVHKNIEIISL